MTDPTVTISPALDAREALRAAGVNLQSLFDRFPFAVQVYTPDGHPVYVNPAYRTLWGRPETYAPPADYVVFENAGLERLGLMPFIRRGFAGESLSVPVTRYTIADEPTLPDGRPIWLRTSIYPIHDQAAVIRAVVVMHTDVTEREEAQELLEQRVADRTRELTALLDVSRSINSTLTLETVLDSILEQLQRVIDYRGATIGILDGDDLWIAGSRAVTPEREADRGLRFPLDRSGTIVATIGANRPVIIDDVRGDSLEARDYRAINTGLMEEPTHREIRSWMGVPLAVKDRVIGQLSMSQDVPAYFTTRHAELALAFAAQAATAIENARLYEAERRTAEELTTLLEVSRAVSSTLELEPLLGVLLDQIKIVADYDGASVDLIDGDSLRTLLRRAPTTVGPEYAGTMTTPIAGAGRLWEMIVQRQPVIIGDVRGDEPLAAAYRGVTGAPLENSHLHYIRAWMAIPLALKDRVIGFVALAHREPNQFTPRHAALVAAIASQAATAIEGAHLVEQERRTAREVTSLLEVSRVVSSTLELEPLLGLILDQLKLLVDFTSATAITREGGHYQMREYRGPLLREAVRSRSLPTDAVDSLIGLFPQDRTFIIPDVWADTAEADAWRATGSEEYLRTAPTYMGCLLNAPLIHKGQLIGLLTLGHRTPGHFTAHHAALTQAVADQVTGLIENARLFEQEHRTAQELASLLEVSRNLASTLELEPLLDLILDQIKVVAEYDGAVITTHDDDRVRLLRRRAPTILDPDHEWLRGFSEARLPATEREAMSRREPVIIDDVRGDDPVARAWRAGFGAPLETSHGSFVRSWMAAPLALTDRVIGRIVLSHSQPGYYTPHHAALVMAIATQAAAAIENARLYGEAHKLAALEERQRLARELHDSVSQVLFSVGLGARTLRTLLDRGDAARAIPSVEYIAKLAAMGTAEMRALLFELRPESLEQEGLVGALAKQAAALEARHDLVVALELGDEPDLSLDAKEALYRIAQEAMHNTVKHARASRLDLRLASGSGGVHLDVADNGAGFDAAGSFPGHLGLVSMRERVARFGGGITVESAPDQGTAVRVTIPSGR